MISIYGKKYGFLLTAEAAVKIADMCPEGDLEKIEEAITGKTVDETIAKQCKFAKILNEGFCEFEKLMGREAAQLDENAIKKAPFGVYVKIKDEAFAAFLKGLQGEIDAEPTDTKKAITEAEG